MDYETLYNSKIIDATGGSDGARDIGLVKNVLSRVETSFGGNYLYKTDIDKIAAIAYFIIITNIVFLVILKKYI